MAQRRGTIVRFIVCRVPCRIVRRRKSRARKAKTVIATNWIMMPATMILVPGLVSPSAWFDAFEARPPPMA